MEENNDTTNNEIIITDAVSYLKNELKKSYCISLAILAIAIFCFIISIDDNIGGFAVIAVVLLIADFFVICGIPRQKRELKEAKENPEVMANELTNRKIKENQIKEKYKAQIEESEKEKYKYDHPICPMCQSNNTRRITTLNRAVSVSMVGLASSKIGKQYECLKCKHKW